MRKQTVILALFSLLLWCHPSHGFAQDGYSDSVKAIKNELKAYQAQLESIDESLVTYSDYELYSSIYRDCNEKMDIFYEENKSFIVLQEPALSAIWSGIKDLREEIDAKIENLKLEDVKESKKRELETEFSLTAMRYDQLNAKYKQLGQMKKRVAKDSLLSLKNRETELFTDYSARKIQNKELISQSPSLDSLCKHIDTLHQTISEAKDIETVKWGDLIFKVTIIAALLFFLINLIVSKKNLKKQLNGKKNKHIPSI